MLVQYDLHDIRLKNTTFSCSEVDKPIRNKKIME